MDWLAPGDTRAVGPGIKGLCAQVVLKTTAGQTEYQAAGRRILKTVFEGKDWIVEAAQVSGLLQNELRSTDPLEAAAQLAEAKIFLLKMAKHVARLRHTFEFQPSPESNQPNPTTNQVSFK